MKQIYSGEKKTNIESLNLINLDELLNHVSNVGMTFKNEMKFLS